MLLRCESVPSTLKAGFLSETLKFLETSYSRWTPAAATRGAPEVRSRLCSFGPTCTRLDKSTLRNSVFLPWARLRLLWLILKRSAEALLVNANVFCPSA